MVGELAEIVALAHGRASAVVDRCRARATLSLLSRRCRWAAEDAGTDVVAESTHRWRPALSQGSLLLLSDPALIDPLYEHVNDLGAWLVRFPVRSSPR